MSQTLLLMRPLYQSTQDELESLYTVHRYWEADDKDALLTKIGTTCTGVVTDGGAGVSNAVLDELPNAKMVSVFGVGVDAIDLPRCSKDGISVGNTPDVLSDDVADLAVALALGVCRQLVNGDNHARQGKWAADGPMPLTVRMMGKKAGIFGMGSIGNCLAKRLSSFDMPISYCNRSAKPGSPHRFVASLEQLAADVDFLFITAAATEGTIGAVTTSVLDALGPKGYLINVSRGTLVDEPALVEALSNLRIAGAGLDVFHDEPNIPQELMSMSNVVMQPHCASGTFETRQAMGDLVLSNLAAYFTDKPLPARVV